MTVKELKDILDAYNDDAIVCVHQSANHAAEILHNHQVFRSQSGESVTFVMWAPPEEEEVH